MTLALLVPNDYRQPAVLVRLAPDSVAYVTGFPHPLNSGENAAIYSFAESGGVVMRLHRDDQTPVVPRSRRSPHSDY